jgi:hypothetical protein
MYTAGKYPRSDEIALGIVDDKALLVINRVTTSKPHKANATTCEHAQHRYVNYTMNWSPDMGKSWTRWAPDHNISRAMAGQWSVMPKILQLPNTGEIMLAGGRPGIMLWIGGREQGTAWQSINVAARHNRGVKALGTHAGAEWAFDKALESLPPRTAPVPNLQDRTCCPHPNCTQNGAWCQSTAYSSIMPVGTNSSEYVVIYDWLANGWGGPPGQWGRDDKVFSMRFSLKVDDTAASLASSSGQTLQYMTDFDSRCDDDDCNDPQARIMRQPVHQPFDVIWGAQTLLSLHPLYRLTQCHVRYASYNRNSKPNDCPAA